MIPFIYFPSLVVNVVHTQNFFSYCRHSFLSVCVCPSFFAVFVFIFSFLPSPSFPLSSSRSSLVSWRAFLLFVVCHFASLAFLIRLYGSLQHLISIPFLLLCIPLSLILSFSVFLSVSQSISQPLCLSVAVSVLCFFSFFIFIILSLYIYLSFYFLSLCLFLFAPYSARVCLCPCPRLCLFLSL